MADGLQGQFVTERQRKPAAKSMTDQASDTTQDKDGGTGRNVIMRPATYDGSGPWPDYKAHFDACASLNGWDEKQKGLYLSVSLRGQAQGVFGNLAAGSNDFPSLVRALEDRFAPPNQTELYRVQLKGRQQKATESMAELGQDIRRLTNLAYPSAPNDVRETLAKEQFMDALANADMRLKVKQSRPKDLNDAVRHAVELESFYRAEKRQQGMVCSAMPNAESRTETKELKQTLAQVKETLQRINSENQKGAQRESRPTEQDSRWGRHPQDGREQPMSDRQPPASRGYAGRTFENTQLSGQRTDNRSNVLRCYNCGSEKHFIRDCPEPKQHGNSRRHNFNKSGLASSAGLYARAKIDGISAECLVDTGATLTLISNKLWELIKDKHTLSNFNTPIISASGDAMKITGRTEVLLEFEDIKCPVRVIIAEMDVDMVLGIDFMKSCGVSIDVTKDVMTVKGKDIPLSCIGKVGCYRIVLTEKIEVPAGTEIITTGKIQEPGVSRLGYGLVEPNERFMQLGKGLVARTLVKAGDTVPLRMANLSEEAQTYYPGTNVATISQVSKIEGKIDDPKYNRLPEHMQELYRNASEGMDQEQKKQVRRLLVKYAHLFSTDDSDIGRTGIIKHQIPTGNARPIKQPVRRLPVHMQEEVDAELDKMLSGGIIQPSTSPWASGVVLVKKKDGSRRFCVDYRRLNDVTIKDAYPLPRIDESLDQLAGSTWFSCLDLSSGYWQVEVDEVDKTKTAFSTRRGLFEFKYMPFGLCNAPATFERLMECVLAGLHWKICLVYLDDIIVVGKTFDEMLANLETVFLRFEEAGLKMKPRKCQLFKKEVDFLGHVINELGAGTDPKKIECIQQ